jgi:hypothetical protein
MSFRLHERTMTMAPFETVMTFDGSNVDARAGAAVVDGDRGVPERPIKRVLDSPSLDLVAEGQRQSRQAIKWVPPPPVPSRHGDDRRDDHRPGANFAADLTCHSNTLDVGRERELGSRARSRSRSTAFSGTDL